VNLEIRCREAAAHLAEFRRYVESRFPELLEQPVRWLKQGSVSWQNP
jgi:hypothetical protein